MIYLCKLPEVEELERFRLIGIETPETEGKDEHLLNIACEAIFGARYSAIPDWFYEESEPWNGPIEQRAWAAKRGYDLTDDFGQLLRCANEMSYMIEALERRLISPNENLIAQRRERAWASALEAEARQFSMRSR